MYRFEWNYDEIKGQNSFTDLVEWIGLYGNLCNYEQAARLFYTGKNMTVMIELQIPTKEMLDLTGENETPWLDAYEVENMTDYNASREIYTGIGNGEIITYENAERLMLSLAKELCD